MHVSLLCLLNLNKDAGSNETSAALVDVSCMRVRFSMHTKLEQLMVDLSIHWTFCDRLACVIVRFEPSVFL